MVLIAKDTNYREEATELEAAKMEEKSALKNSGNSYIELEREFLEKINEFEKATPLLRKILKFKEMKSLFQESTRAFYFVSLVVHPEVKLIKESWRDSNKCLEAINDKLVEILKMCETHLSRKEFISIVDAVKDNYRASLFQDKLVPFFIKSKAESEEVFQSFPEEQKEDFLKSKSVFYLENGFDPKVLAHTNIYFLPFDYYENQFQLFKSMALDPAVNLGHPGAVLQNEEDLKKEYILQIKEQDREYYEKFSAWIIRDNEYCPIGSFSIFPSSIDEGSFSYSIDTSEQKRGWGWQCTAFGIVRYILEKMPRKDTYSILIKKQNTQGLQFAEKISRRLNFDLVDKPNENNSSIITFPNGRKKAYAIVLRRAMETIKFKTSYEKLKQASDKLYKNTSICFRCEKKAQLGRETLEELICSGILQGDVED